MTANKRQHIPSELASISASTCVECAPQAPCVPWEGGSWECAFLCQRWCPSEQFIPQFWAMQPLVPAQALWLRPGRRWRGDRMCGGAGSPGTGHFPELSCHAAPAFPLNFAIPRLQIHSRSLPFFALLLASSIKSHI